MNAVPGTAIKDLTVQEFADNGLLWLVNASVFHPRGLALGIRVGADGVATLTMNSTGGEDPIQYADSMSEIVDQCFVKSEEFIVSMRRQYHDEGRDADPETSS